MESMFELLDCVEAEIFWMLDFASENNIPPERLSSLNHLVKRTISIFEDLKNLENQLGYKRRFDFASGDGCRPPRDKLTPYQLGEA